MMDPDETRAHESLKCFDAMRLFSQSQKVLSTHAIEGRSRARKAMPTGRAWICFILIFGMKHTSSDMRRWSLIDREIRLATD